MIAGAASLILLAGASVAQMRFEKPPVLSAADLLPPEQLQGPTHRVEPEVPTDGFLARFTVHSPHGSFEVRGRSLLDIRLHELRALDELAKVNRGEVFVEGAGEAAIETGKAIGRAVASPKETLQGIPQGVGRFFERTVRVGATGVQKVQDRLEDAKEQGEDFGTDEAMIVAGSAANVTADALGRSHERRKLARDLQVDPYTTNPVLDARLEEVAKAAFAGALGVNVAKMFVPGGTIISSTTRVSNWVWDTPPGDLLVEIQERLQQMGAPQSQIDALLRDPAWSLTLQVALVAALDELKDVPGRGSALRLALAAENDVQARFVVTSLRMLARHHRSLGKLASVEAPRPLAARTEDGELIVVAPVDQLAWTKRLAARVDDPDLAAAKRSIWLTGQATPRTRAELATRGWRLNEGVATVGQPSVPAVTP